MKLGLVIIVAIPTKNSIVVIVTYIDRYIIHKYTYNNRTVIEYLKKNHLYYYVWSLLNAL